MASPHREQLQLTAGREGQHADESDEIVRVVRGRPEASQIVHAAVSRGAYAAAEIVSEKLTYPGYFN